MTYEPREVMAHKTFDTFDLQAVKRLWWNLYDMRRSLGDMLDTDGNMSRLMCDLEAIAMVMQGTTEASLSK